MSTKTPAQRREKAAFFAFPSRTENSKKRPPKRTLFAKGSVVQTPE